MDKVIVSLNKETIESNNAELLLCEVVKYLKETPKKDYDHYLGRLNEYIESNKYTYRTKNTQKNKLKYSSDREHVLKTICEIKRVFRRSDVIKNQKAPLVSKATVSNVINILLKAEILIIIPTTNYGRVYRLN